MRLLSRVPRLTPWAPILRPSGAERQRTPPTAPENPRGAGPASWYNRRGKVEPRQRRPPPCLFPRVRLEGLCTMRHPRRALLPAAAVLACLAWPPAAGADGPEPTSQALDFFKQKVRP